MSNYYLIENKNPIVSATRADGKQEISVHDYKTGNRRNLIVEKSKVDEFINTRSAKLEEQTEKWGKKISKTAVVGGAITGTLAFLSSFLSVGGIFFSMAFGAICSIIGAGLSCVIPSLKMQNDIEKTDKDLTQKFIDINA